MTLIDCTRCGEPVLARDPRCPHCGAARLGGRARERSVVVIAGVALVGCLPIAEPAYGIAEVGSDGWEESATTTTTSADEQGTTSWPTSTTQDPSLPADTSAGSDESTSSGTAATETTSDASTSSETTDPSTSGSGTDESTSSSTSGDVVTGESSTTDDIGVVTDGSSSDGGS